MTSCKEGEGITQSVTLRHKGVTYGGSQNVHIRVTQFMNGPHQVFVSKLLSLVSRYKKA